MVPFQVRTFKIRVNGEWFFKWLISKIVLLKNIISKIALVLRTFIISIAISARALKISITPLGAKFHSWDLLILSCPSFSLSSPIPVVLSLSLCKPIVVAALPPPFALSLSTGHCNNNQSVIVSICNVVIVTMIASCSML